MTNLMNKIYKEARDMLVTYEVVIVGTGVVVTSAVMVFGFVPLAMVASVVAPVAAGVAAYKFGL